MDKILVTSKGFIPKIEKLGIYSSKIYYLPQWAENIFNQVPIKSDFHYLESQIKWPNGFVITFAGNIGTSQSFETIISAANLLKNYQDIYFVILGNGIMKQWSEQEVERLNLNNKIIFLGQRKLSEMPYFYSKSDALLVSLIDTELFSITVPAKIQTYLLSGKPIIASIAGEGARIIEESCSGYVCKPSKADDLASIVLKMYHTSENERKYMGDRGKAYAQIHFDRNYLIDQIIHLFNNTKYES